MKEVEELRDIVNKKIAGFCDKNGSGSLFQPINYIMQLGGKRMRPILSLMAANLFTENLEEATYPSIALEIFHNFTLMHDDIMDKSPLRRGKATVHSKWNDNAAILSGDTMLVQSYQLLIKTNQEHLLDLIRIFNQTAIAVCEGQQQDMEFENRSSVSVDEYLEMIRLKTSVLIGSSMQIGALIGGAEEADQKRLYEFGESLGMAFQLRDDYLDIFGELEETGKQVGGDILSDKKTFLLIRAFEKAGTEELVILDKYIGNRSHSDTEKVSSIRDVYEQLELRNELHQLAKSYFDKAISSLNNVSVPDMRKELLYKLAAQLQNRHH